MHPVVWIAVVTLAPACTGTIGGMPPGDAAERDVGQSGQAAAGAAGGGSEAPTAAPPDGRCEVAPARAPLRRLTRAEYTNTVRDLLFIKTTVADGFEADTAVAGFATNGIATLSASATQDYAEAATTLAAQVELAKIVPCDAPSGTDACARLFITTFGRRALRRPLAQVEIDALFKVYANKKARSDFSNAVRLVVETLLQTPSFLYRPDVAGDDDSADTRLSRGFELASRLSYFLWGTMPDDQLLDAAQAGTLLAAAGREPEIRRLIADPRAGAAIRSFYDQWTDGPRLATTDKDGRLFPQFQAPLKASMREETGRFVEHVYQEENGSLAILLTAPFGFVDAGLAKLYGVAAPASGFARANLPAGQRSGLLTHAGFLAGHAFATEPSPIHRGLFVRRKLLCQELTLPPNVEIKPPVVDPDVSIKERLAQHRADPTCAGCHRYMDPIGFGFGHYDAIGAWQTMQGNFPVDAEGELVGTDDIDGPFNGAVELGQRLAGSATVHRCMTQQWFSFALGRAATAGEECLIDELTRQLDARGLDLRELAVAIANSEAFASSRTN